MESICDKAWKDAKYSCMKSLYETLLRNEEFESLPDDEQYYKLYLSLKEQCDNMGDPILKTFNWVWLTISPESQHGFDSNPEKLQHTIQQWLQKCDHVYVYYYSLEQRSENHLNITGVHAHVLIKRHDNMTYSRYNQWITRKWGPYHGVKFQMFKKNKTGSIYYKDDDFKEKKMLYLQGVKEGEHKQALVRTDIEWRKNHKLQNLYSHSDPTRS